MSSMSTMRERALNFTNKIKRICAIPWPVLVIVFACLLFLCLLFPFSGDDWYWGSSMSNAKISSFFANYNGRYFSNLLCVALTRVPFLHAPVVAAVLLGIVLCVQKLVGRKDTSVFWLCLVIIFITPTAMFSQGLVWTSGFVNYTVSAFIVLLYILAVKGALETEYSPCKKLIVPLFFLGFIGSLIVETLTIANVIASLVILIYTYRKHKIFDGTQLAFFIGALAGAVLMFSNGAYISIVQGNDTVKVNGSSYRQIAPGGALSSALSVAATSLVPHLVLKAWPLQTLFAISMFINCFYLARSGKKRRAIAIGVCAFVCALVAIYGLWYSLCAPEEFSTQLKAANVVAGLFSALALFAWCILLWRAGNKKALLVFLYALALVLPVLFVSKYGPRNYLPAYILLGALFCLCFDDMLVPEGRQTPVPTFLIVTIFLFVSSVFPYLYANDIVIQREEIVEQAKESGASEITLPGFASDTIVWHGNPATPTNGKSAYLANWFCSYYGLDKDTKITVTTK